MTLKNNPLCLPYGSIRFDGELEPKNGYCQFISVGHCFLAGFNIVARYIDSGRDTLGQLAKIWYSDSDQSDIDNFVEFVSSRMMISKTFRLQFCPGDLIHFLSAVAFYQSDYINDVQIRWSFDKFKYSYVH